MDVAAERKPNGISEVIGGVRIEEAGKFRIGEVIVRVGTFDEPELGKGAKLEEEHRIADVGRGTEVLRGEVGVDAQDAVEGHGLGPVEGDLGRIVLFAALAASVCVHVGSGGTGVCEEALISLPGTSAADV